MLGARLLAELEHQALAEIARADARRVEALDDREHLLGFGHRVERRRRVAGPPRGLVPRASA